MTEEENENPKVIKAFIPVEDENECFKVNGKCKRSDHFACKGKKNESR